MSEFNPAKYRAKIRILSHIAQFSLQRYFGDHAYSGSKDMAFQAGAFDSKGQVGDLVSLNAAPMTKWYLSWVVQRHRPEGYSEDVFVLESIEDGELCNWTNVGMDYYDRDQVAKHPEWRWLDEQYELNDRWFKACRQTDETYIHPPNTLDFIGNDVSFSVRTKWNFGARPEPDPIVLPNWKKIKMREMKEVYLRMVEAAVARDKKKEPA